MTNNYQQEKPKVRVNMHPVFSAYANVPDDVFCHGYTVRNILEDLVRQYPSFDRFYREQKVKDKSRFRLHRGVILILADRDEDVTLDLEFKVRDGEELAIIKAIQGG